jgi:hypothetical protein
MRNQDSHRRQILGSRGGEYEERLLSHHEDNRPEDGGSKHF